MQLEVDGAGFEDEGEGADGTAVRRCTQGIEQSFVSVGEHMEN